MGAVDVFLAEADDAEAFADEYGGELLDLDDITPEMVANL